VTTTGNVVEATVKADNKCGACAAVLNRQNYTLTISNAIGKCTMAGCKTME